MTEDQPTFSEPGSTGPVFTNPDTVVTVFTVRILDSSVTLPFRTTYSEFIQIANLQDRDPSKTWWWVLPGNVHGKRKILDDQEDYSTLLKDLEQYPSGIILEKLSSVEAYDSS